MPGTGEQARLNRAPSAICVGITLTADGQPELSDSVGQQIEGALATVLRERHGSGRHVKVAIDRRPRLMQQPLVQVAIWHEGDRDKILEFDDRGEVTSRPSSRAIQAAIQFDPAAGTIEVAARGGSPVHAGFAGAFASCCWPEQPELIPLGKAAWALQGLKSPMKLVVDRSTGIGSVALVEMGLRPCGAGRLRIQLMSAKPDESIWTHAAN